MKIAVLVSHPSEFQELQLRFGRKDVLFIASTYLVQQLLKPHTLDPFLPSDHTSQLLDTVLHLGHYWFRDSTGHDLLFHNNFSVGPVISRRSMYALANDIRSHTAIRHWLKVVDTIYISSAESGSLLKVSQLFGERIRLYTTTDHQKPIDTTAPELAFPSAFPHINPLSGCARFAQKLFWRQVRNRKILHLPDWTSDHLMLQRSDSSVHTTYKLWKGFYYKLDRRFMQKADALLPAELDPAVANVEQLGHCLDRAGLELNPGLLDLFTHFMRSFYAQNRHFYVRTYAIYRELFEYYQPKMVTFPGETHFSYLIGLQVAKALGIETLLIPDGYQTLNDPSLFYMDQDNQGHLCDKFMAFGQAHLDLLLRSGVPREKCVLSSPTILTRHTPMPQKQKKYDAVIMSYAPHLPNPDARWDLSDKFLVDIVQVLLELGMRNIAIKLKTVTNLTHNVMDILRANNLPTTIELLTGNFVTQIFPQAACVVGQISTAAIEAYFHGLPYYVYEPPANGKSDAMFSGETLFSLERVARTPEQLKINIQRGVTGITASKEYILDGPSLAEIHLLQTSA